MMLIKTEQNFSKRHALHILNTVKLHKSLQVPNLHHDQNLASVGSLAPAVMSPPL
jgi:hypothetical protein